LGDIFNTLGTLALQLDILQNSLPANIALKTLLQNSIQTELAPAFARLIAYFKAAETLNLIDESSNKPLAILGVTTKPFSEQYQNEFSDHWFKQTSKTPWKDFLQAISADDTIFGGGLLSDTKEILNFAATHNLFTGIFDLFIKTYARVVAEAIKNLQSTFTENNQHEPHFALYLAFLRLFDYVRAHTNTLTLRHLDFYYQEVLHLKQKAAEANQAHVTIQLAKHQQSHLLKAGTEFNGGKDKAGKAVTYELKEDFAANVASVFSLKSISLIDGKLYVYPTSNSADGFGAELTTPTQQWPAFPGTSESANLAEVGFAIASHYLLLAEGRRLIRLTLKLSSTISQKHFAEAYL